MVADIQSISKGGADSIYSNKTYIENNPDWHLVDAPWKASEIVRILDRNSVQWNNAVEVGCGSGGVVSALAERYPDKQFAGYDISVDAQRFWLPVARPNLDLVSGDFLSTRCHFDVLLLINVFEHVEDYMGFLRTLKGKADYYIFHIPLDLHVQGLIRNGLLLARQKVGHLHYFSKATALATLKDTGYAILDNSYTNLAFETNKQARKMQTHLLNPVRRALAYISIDKTALLLGGYSLIVLAR